MTALPDDDLSEEQIRRMEAKLLAGFKPTSAVSGLSDVEKRMAEKVLGPTETARLARMGSDRRYRYRKPVHSVEYYRTDWGWRFDLFENGIRQPKPFKDRLDDDEMKIVLKALQDRRIPTRIFETEAERIERERLASMPIQIKDGPCHKNKPKSERYWMLNSLKDFRV